MAKLVFAVEPLESTWDEMIVLAQMHWNETQQHRHFQGFKPLLERYAGYARAGWFVQFTVRDEGKLVGYGGVFIVPSMHTQETIATEDTWYLKPEYRSGWNAIRFYKFMESFCRAAGAVEVTLTLPVAKNLNKLVEFLGYKQVSGQFSKRLTQARADSAISEPLMETEDVCAIATARP